MGLNQYQIILVNLNPTIGSEVQKTRPCVIISPNEMNKYLRTLVVAPMTSRSKQYPSCVAIEHDNKTGWVVLDQIRTIDKLRVVKHLGNLSESETKEIKSVIHEIFVA